MDACAEIRRRGWTQGSILDGESGRKFLDGQFSEEDCVDFVLISHPCDVVANDFNREPDVELICRRLAATKDGNLTYAKNVRVWQYEEADRIYELRMRDRRTTARRLLAEVDPAGALHESHTRVLRRWLSNRYARAAFPDAFNERLRPAISSVRRRLTTSGSQLSGIYILVDGRELPAGEDYRIFLTATMLEEDFGDQTMRQACAAVVNQVATDLDGCTGVAVEDSGLRSEADLSLADLRALRRWDYDTLSLRDDASALPPEGA